MNLPLISLALLACLLLLATIYALRTVSPLGLPRTRNKNRRMLPVLSQAHKLTPRECGQCYHFEPTGFEEVQRRAPAAAEAARWLSPAQMAVVEKKKTPEGWTEDAGFEGVEGQPAALGGPRWDEVGVCHKKTGTLTFQHNPDCGSWR